MDPEHIVRACYPGRVLAPATSSTEHLRDAVAGLAGLVGFVLVPALASWAKVALQMLERDRVGLGRPGHVSGLVASRAAGWSVLLLFFTFTAMRAAQDLRQLQLEAPVLALGLRGAAAGLVMYVLVSAALSLLRRDRAHRRAARKMPRRLEWR